VPGTIDSVRAGLIRGSVLDRAGAPLPGVVVTIAEHPELGQTVTRASGGFDLVVNAGGPLTLRFDRQGFIAAQRTVNLRWQEQAVLEPVVLIGYDPIVTTISMNAPTPQVARGSRMSDSRGERMATLIVPAGTAAEIVDRNGGVRSVGSLNVRATEYTVGPNGPNAMPAELPESTAYTYCVELSADEALDAAEVRFSKPVAIYVENFLGFFTGNVVPVGHYDRVRRAWVPSDNGIVLRIVAVSGGVAQIDTNGDGQADSASVLASRGIDAAEQAELASLYTPGQSLWRAAMSHFTPGDMNWLAPALPPGAITPAMPRPNVRTLLDDCNTACGSIIELQNRALRETLPIAGTGVGLTYNSSMNRSGGRVDVQLTDANAPAILKRVEASLTVAGRRFDVRYDGAPNLRHAFIWDGRDAYGRHVQGGQVAVVSIVYVYDSRYQAASPAVPRAFGSVAAAGNTASPLDARARQSFTVQIGGVDAGALGLGGWTLSLHHFYDPNTQRLHFGNGATSSADAQQSGRYTVRTVAGNGLCCFGGDGGAAVEARLGGPDTLAIGPDGSVYVMTSFDSRVRRISRNGVITTVAGNGSSGFTADGAPAATSRIRPESIALGADGTLYIAEFGNNRVRAVAGSGASGSTGDGGPAVSAAVSPREVAIGRDGALYIADATSIRRVTADGLITRFAGGGSSVVADGLRAVSAQIVVERLAVGPDDTIYFATQSAVYRITSAGIIRLVGGCASCSGDPIEGGSATAGRFLDIEGLAVAADGTVFVTDRSRHRIYAVTTNGRIATAVGVGNEGRNVREDALARGAELAHPYALAIGPDRHLYFSDQENYRVRVAQPLYPDLPAGQTSLASAGGGQVHVFSGGRHERTMHGLTGAALLTFAYDAEGRLKSMTDVDGQTLVIEHGDDEATIVAPGGQETVLSFTDGHLSELNGPGIEFGLEYDDDTGLLETMTDSRGGVYSFTFDERARLIRDADPAGGSTTLTQTGDGDAYTITKTSAEGQTTSYEMQLTAGGGSVRTNTTGSLVVRSEDAGNGTRIQRMPDGTVVKTTQTPDPRLGMQAPLTATELTLPSGKVVRTSQSRQVALANRNDDPFSVTTVTDTLTMNGRTWTNTFDAAARKLTTRTPSGRISETTIDSAGRVVAHSLPGVTSTTMGYSGGMLTSVAQGTRRTTMTYDDEKQLHTIEDSSGRTTEFVYDDDGRLTRQVLPDTNEISFTYDDAGNVLSLTPPERPAHMFGYDAVDLATAYTPPPVAGAAKGFSFEYDRDRQLKLVHRPDGVSVAFGYDDIGRLTTVSSPSASYTHGYASSGQLSSITGPAGQQVTYSYDGPLVLSATWSGEVEGTVAYTYDNDLRVTSENGVAMTYDADGLLMSAGALVLTRDAQNGRVTGSTLQKVGETFTYAPTGELSVYSATYDGTPVFSSTATRDGSGRITTLTETVAGTPITTTFTYDPAGRLATATRAGFGTTSYEYDANGNRIERITAGKSVTATYDAQDRLLTYGDATYTYTATGDLKTKTDPSGTTTYDYDAMGNLRRVALPDGRVIDYVIDGQNRRVGKKVDGALVQGWLYADGLRVAAELNGTGAVVSRFVYATRSNVPDYIIRAEGTYRVLSDHRGSPRVIVHTATGAVAQTTGYDEFGNILSASAEGFQPLGFAGGLYDSATRFIRFGARDYDSETGRFVSKDPLGFGGTSANLYAYTFNDPVNFIDPDGQVTIPLFGWVDAGENAGSRALTHWADRITDPNTHGLDLLGSIIGGVFAALWTPCTSDGTVATLSTALGVNGYVGRSFYQYYPANNAAYQSRFLTRGPGWRPPYNPGPEAAEKLALPPWNSGTALRSIPSRWDQFVGGPGRVTPKYGHGGGGVEYMTGGWPR